MFQDKCRDHVEDQCKLWVPLDLYRLELYNDEFAVMLPSPLGLPGDHVLLRVQNGREGKGHDRKSMRLFPEVRCLLFESTFRTIEIIPWLLFKLHP